MAKERINEVLHDLVKAKGTNEKVAKPLGITPQALGRYMKGRTPPLSFVLKWKEVYKDDLLVLSGMTSEPIVSLGIEPFDSFKHQITEGDYIGLHKLAWDEFQKTLINSRKVLTKIAVSNGKLTDTNAELSRGIMELLKRITQTERQS